MADGVTRCHCEASCRLVGDCCPEYTRSTCPVVQAAKQGDLYAGGEMAVHASPAVDADEGSHRIGSTKLALIAVAVCAVLVILAVAGRRQLRLRYSSTVIDVLARKGLTRA